jgi:transporter family protein
VNIIDKYVLEKWVNNPAIPVVISSVLGIVFSIIIYFWRGFALISIENLILAFISGTCYIVSILYYFKAVKIEEISRVIPLYHLAPLFVLLFATIFLNEVFTFITYIGIFFLIGGAFAISIKGKFRLKMGKPLIYMILSSILIALYSVIAKYLLSYADFWSVYAYIRIGTIFVLVPLIFMTVKDFRITVKKQGGKAITALGIAEGLNLVAVLLLTYALSIGFVSLVNALAAVQPFFVLLFTLILSFNYPKILKEEIGRSTILLKVFAITAMFIGVLMIT